jgi:murein DD-endopeptidase MepM/ murein hydrolase activator NlpD
MTILKFFCAKIFLGALPFYFGLTACQLEKPEVSPPESPVIEEVIEPEIVWDTFQIQRGQNLGSLVHSHFPTGISGKALNQFLQVYTSPIFPGQTYAYRQDTLEFSDTAQVFSYHFKLYNRSKTTRYSIDAHSDSISTIQEELPVTSDTVSLTFVLETSLWDAIIASGESPALLERIVQIFSWDIDFFNDPRQGDTCQIWAVKRYNSFGEFIGYSEPKAVRYMNNRPTPVTHWALFHETSDGESGYYDTEGRSLQKAFLRAPLQYTRVSSGFNLRRKHPVLGIVRPHWGVDFAAPTGTPVYASADGVIEYAKWVGGYGHTIKIRHNAVYNTYYAHLSRYASVAKPGTRVRQGQTIGFVGSTGVSTGPHLDYRLEVSGRYVDPRAYQSNPLRNLPAKEMELFTTKVLEAKLALGILSRDIQVASYQSKVPNETH